MSAGFPLEHSKGNATILKDFKVSQILRRRIVS